MNTAALPWLGSLCVVAGSGVSAGLLVYAAWHSTRLAALIARHVEQLDAPLRRMLLPARGRLILSLQAIVVPLALGCAVALRMSVLTLVAAAAVWAPRLVIGQLQKRRRAAIEAKLDMFALALANATRATPSVGRALHMLQTSLTSPLDAEVAQVLREMRVGSSLEQALLNFSWRVQSQALDALLSNVLIALRVGGNLAEVLETTAATLREMARLDGVLRAKTAQARTQMWVLGCLPPFIVVAFNAVNPGFFDPLTASTIGVVLLIAAMLLWLCAILLARRILAVEL